MRASNAVGAEVRIVTVSYTPPRTLHPSASVFVDSIGTASSSGSVASSAVSRASLATFQAPLPIPAAALRAAKAEQGDDEELDSGVEEGSDEEGSGAGAGERE